MVEIDLIILLTGIISNLVFIVLVIYQNDQIKELKFEAEWKQRRFEHTVYKLSEAEHKLSKYEVAEITRGQCVPFKSFFD